MRTRSNLAEIATRHRRRQDSIPPLSREAARRGAEVLEAASKAVLQQQVYSVPIPQNANGTPKWDRTQALLDNEKAVARGLTIVMSNRTPHALPRYTLGLPGHRKPVFTRSVQWQQVAVRQERRRVLGLRREGLWKAIKRR